MLLFLEPQEIALHDNPKEVKPLAITLERTETNLIHRRSGVACDQACSGHVGVVSQDQCHHELMGLPDYDRQVIRNTYQIGNELIGGSIHL